MDTKLNDSLIIEGLAREVVNKINSMRRDEGFDVSDRIHVEMQTTDRVKTCFELHGNYICNEVLAVSVEFKQCEGAEWDLNGEAAVIRLEKVSIR